MSRALVLSEEVEGPTLVDAEPAGADWSGGLATGQVVASRYRLRRLLGRGGMGIVYEATHLGFGRRVAIKLLRPELLAQDDYDTRFIGEGRCLAAVSSDHVVRLLDAGRLGSGLPFLVMERLTGMNLAELLKVCGPLSPATAVSYAQQLCAGLAAVHAGGMAHLDIKPTNLFLVSRGRFPSRLKILDFGIARWLRDPSANLTEDASNLMGSPRYSSPEQLDDPEAIDERSDVWSVGVVLFEMLTGTTPFAATCFTGICARVLLFPTPSLLLLQATLDRRLVAVVEACLEKRREHRFSSVRALAEALTPFGLGRAPLPVWHPLRRVETISD